MRLPSFLRDRADRRLQQRTNPTSRFQLSVNATDLFDRYNYSPELDEAIDAEDAQGGIGIPSMEVTEIAFGQTIDFPLTNSDNVVLSGKHFPQYFVNHSCFPYFPCKNKYFLNFEFLGNVSSRNGNGSGSVSCSWKKVHSDSLSHELDLAFGNWPRFGAKAFKRLTKKSFANMSGKEFQISLKFPT